jgi:peptide/nickel transport system permease protein
MALQQSELHVGVIDAQVMALATPVLPDDETDDAVRRSSLATQIPLALCITWLVVVIFGAITAPWLPIQDPEEIAPIDRLQGPSGQHWFGTDELGRDIFARAVWGARVSLIVAVASAAIGLVIGGGIGIVAGYLRGRTDTVISWVMDVILSFPGLVLLIALVAYTGGGLLNICTALGLLSIPVFARLARAHSLSVGREEFVLAARASGAGRRRVLWREIMPNVLPALSAYALVAMSLAIVVEGGLSFLGLSVSAPTPSWGGLIANGQNFLRESTSGVLIPSAVLCVTVLSLNVIGERARRRYEVGASG